jgi:glycosyltransferase involved in cell wall biosynthesis
MKLTIAIPTYNRKQTLFELLQQFELILGSISSSFVIDFIIFDNSDTDETEIALKDLTSIGKSKLMYKKHPKNLGYDGNIFDLYLNATGDYVWFFGDDDVPEFDCIDSIYSGLVSNPDVLLVPFRQPKSLLVPQYQVDSFVCTSEATIPNILNILVSGKLTSYVYKKVNLNEESITRLQNFMGCGWFHIVVALELLYVKDDSKLSTLNRFCASCKSDEDVKNIQWLPTPYIKYDMIFKHPLVFKNYNKDIVGVFTNVYLSGIIITCYGSSGVWKVKSKDDYVQFGLSYPFRNLILLRPKFLIVWILLRLNLTSYFMKVFENHSKKSGY